MKKTLGFIVMLLASLFILVSCGEATPTNANSNNSNSGDSTSVEPSIPTKEEPSINKVAPTYKGMKIINEKLSLTSNVYYYGNNDLNDSSEEYSSKTGEGDEEHLENKNEKPIEKEIEDIVSLEVKTDDTVKYYVSQNEDFILQVELSNPSGFEIQSFTLNGNKYANYMFESGSNMENLYLKVTAPRESGYKEYTIDAIKYIDGTEIKDVDFSKGKQTINVGVTYDIIPSASIKNKVITTTSIEFDLELRDDSNLLKDKDTQIYLSNGSKIVSQLDISVGNNKVKFDDLKINNLYQYAVISSYDKCDGKKEQVRTIIKDEDYTLNSYSFNNVIADKDSVTFEIDKVGNASELSYIAIYDKNNDNKVQSKSITREMKTGIKTEPSKCI